MEAGPDIQGAPVHFLLASLPLVFLHGTAHARAGFAFAFASFTTMLLATQPLTGMQRTLSQKLMNEQTETHKQEWERGPSGALSPSLVTSPLQEVPLSLKASIPHRHVPCREDETQGLLKAFNVTWHKGLHIQIYFNREHACEPEDGQRLQEWSCELGEFSFLLLSALNAYMLSYI
ncbi:unnamed protein product [Rangifer tarandus platyrhynchus]|uniref:Uncharacterized protein n=1 Tax=Rangifer tarandus platyrhynchus TaxID=3082113 RepID=A0ABN9A2Z6_RANTA|nr:unnamed protein product [Rangifer tarandus platyrhynchus]